jgi:hypothetical protein
LSITISQAPGCILKAIGAAPNFSPACVVPAGGIGVKRRIGVTQGAAAAIRVLNFCDEGFNNNAFLEMHVPALLEMLGIPYSGAGPACLGACYNKSLVLAAAEAVDVPVPAETYCNSDDLAATIPSSVFPALIKPNFGDSSIGITRDAVVHTWRRHRNGRQGIVIPWRKTPHLRPQSALRRGTARAQFPLQSRRMRVSIGALTHSHVPMAHGGYATT